MAGGKQGRGSLCFSNTLLSHVASVRTAVVLKSPTEKRNFLILCCVLIP